MRPASQMIVPPSIEFNLWTFPRITYKAREGTMLIFPSWLLHGVEMNMSDEGMKEEALNESFLKMQRIAGIIK
jgi:hypothetical protein